MERALHEKASRWEAAPSHKTEAEQFRRESNKEVLGSEEPHRKKKQDEGEHDALNRKARILTEAKIITEIHDAIDTPVGVLLNLLQPLAKGSHKVDRFTAERRGNHHQIWMIGSKYEIRKIYTGMDVAESKRLTPAEQELRIRGARLDNAFFKLRKQL